MPHSWLRDWKLSGVMEMTHTITHSEDETICLCLKYRFANDFTDREVEPRVIQVTLWWKSRHHERNERRCISQWNLKMLISEVRLRDISDPWDGLKNRKPARGKKRTDTIDLAMKVKRHMFLWFKVSLHNFFLVKPHTIWLISWWKSHQDKGNDRWHVSHWSRNMFTSEVWLCDIPDLQVQPYTYAIGRTSK